MNSSTRVLVASSCLMLAISGHARAQEPTDLRECIETIRGQGMSEMASTHLGGIAMLRTGQGSLTFVTMDESGRYYPSFQSNSCPVPGTDPDTLAVRAQRANVARGVERSRLQPLADTDGSGFVSTMEASAFRMLFEFAALIGQLQQSGDYSVEKALIAAGLDAATFESRMKAYDEIQRKALASGVTGFPVLSHP